MPNKSENKYTAKDFMKRTTSLLLNSSLSYIKEVAPTTGNTLSEAKVALTDVKATFNKTSDMTRQNIAKLKAQMTFKNISKWYMTKTDEFGMSEEDLNFDIPDFGDSDSLPEIQLNEAEKNSSKVAKSVVESSQQLSESIISATANLQSSLTEQTATISSGFDRTVKAIDELAKMLASNTSSLIEATMARNNGNDHAPVDDYRRDPNYERDMLQGGKFNFASYRKIIDKNIKGHMLYTTAMMAKMFFDTTVSGGPQGITDLLVESALKRFAPKLTKNLAAMDQALSDSIMSGLLRLGAYGKRSSFGSISGGFAKVFGLNPDKERQSTAKQGFDVKAVSFDSVVHESITQTIPGYLRKILTALGGEDVVYDYRSRSFRSQRSIDKQTRSVMGNTGNLRGASEKVRGAITYSNTNAAIYDLLLSNIGTEYDPNKKLESFSDPSELVKYLKPFTDKSTLKDHQIEAFARQFSTLTGSNNGIIDVALHASRNNMMGSKKISDYIDSANRYGVDISSVKHNQETENRAILENHGIAKAEVSYKDPKAMNKGILYTNRALYEIFRRLDTGINVFQVGSANLRRDPFEKMGYKILSAPFKYRPKDVKDTEQSQNLSSAISDYTSDIYQGPNELLNNTDDEGVQENLSGLQRFGRWSKTKGSKLGRAIFSGSPQEVTSIFKSIISDVSGIGMRFAKKGASKINDTYGNVSGYLKHKLFGTEYSYTDETGQTKEIEKNEKGGIIGFAKDSLSTAFGGIKESSTKWLKDVMGYFNYGDDKDEDKTVASKRKKFLFTSIGAFSGLGLLGGPFGLLTGAIGGLALSGTGWGKKIKEMVFGDGDKKRGLIKGAFDVIYKPIKYEAVKLATKFGNNLKKNVFGPLSDLGLAIKDSITNRAKTAAEKFFGALFKPLRFIGNKIKDGMLKGASFLFRGGVSLPAILQMKLAGGITDAAGLGVGAILNSATNSFAKRSGKIRYDDDGNEMTTADVIKKRREERKAEIAASNAKVKSRKDFYAAEDEKLNKAKADFAPYIEETEKVVDNTGEIRDSVAEIVDILKNGNNDNKDNNVKAAPDEPSSDMAVATPNLTPNGSPEPDDDSDESQNSPKRVKVRSRNKFAPVGTAAATKPSDADPTFNSGIISATASLAASGDVVSNSEATSQQEIVELAANPNTAKPTLIQKFKHMIGLQRERTESEEKKPSVISQLISGVTSGISGMVNNLGPILATALAGIVGFKDIKSLFTDVILDGVPLSEWWGEKSIIGKSFNGLMELSASLAGIAEGPVNTITDGINGAISTFPGLKDVQPIPHVSAGSGPFGSFGTLMLAGLYFKGISAIANVISAGANVIGSAGGAVNNAIPAIANIVQAISKTKGGKVLSTAAAFALPALATYTIAKGGIKHDNVDGAGEEIVDQARTRAATLNVTRGAAQTAFGMRQYVDPIYGAHVKLQANNAAKEAFETATKNGLSDPSYFANNAFNKSLTDRGLNAARFKMDDLDDAAKSGLLQKAVNAVKGVLGKFFDKIKNASFVKKAANGVKFVDDTANKVLDFINVKMFKPIQNKIQALVAKITGKDAITVSTAGIGAAVFGIAGAASGAASAANIFNVREQDVTHGMRLVATAIIAALNAIPMIGYLELVDLVLVPALGISFRQLVCQTLYRLTGEGDTLNELQGKMDESRASYNAKYNSNLSSSEYNDKMNSSLLGKIWHGSTRTDETGDYVADDAGKAVQTGGIKGLFVGGEYEYVKDENGQVVYDEKGKAIRARDEKGHIIKNDKKWFDHVLNWNKDIYSNTFSFLKTLPYGGNPEAAVAEQSAGSLMHTINEYTNRPFELGPDGKPLKGLDNKPIKRGELSKYMQSVMDEANGVLVSPFTNTADALKLYNPPGKNSWFGFGGEVIDKPAAKTSDTSRDPILQDSKDAEAPTKEGGNPLNKQFVVTSHYGNRPQLGDFHQGIDLVPNDGSGKAEVGSRFKGTVTRVRGTVPDSMSGLGVASEYSAGNVVSIDTDTGLRVTNMHLKAGSIPSNLKVGSKVNIGDKIGEMGTTGRSTGPHLHYQIGQLSTGKTFDPLSSVQNGSTMSGFASSGDSTYQPNVSSNSVNGTSSGSSGPSGEGWFAQLMSILKRIGAKFLNKITGGLLFSEEANDSSQNTFSGTASGTISSNADADYISTMASAASFLDPEKPVMLLTNEQVNALARLGAGPAEVIDLLSGISYKIYWGGKPGKTHTDYSTLTPEDTKKKIAAATSNGGKYPSWDPRPCVLKISDFQLAVATHSYNHGSVIGGNPGPECPDMPNSKTTAEWPKGGHFCMYYKDSVSNNNGKSQNALEHQKVAKRALELAKAMIEKAKEAETIKAMVKDGDVKTLYAYLKSKGYSNEAISGILGCWKAESSNTARRIESDYLATNVNYEELGKNRTALDEYTRNVVFAHNSKINRSAYYGKDGKHLFPGLGFAQWTGPRGEDLLKHAEDTNSNWTSPDVQLDFMDKELSTPGSLFGPSNRDVKGKLSKAKKPEEAAMIWAKDYEGYAADQGRTAAAREIYDKFSTDPDLNIATEPPANAGGEINYEPKNISIKNNSNVANVGGELRDPNQYEVRDNKPQKNSSFTMPIEKTSTTTPIVPPIQPSQDNGKMDQLINSVNAMVELLKLVVSNTGDSNGLLSMLNDKDFVDTGLRQSISAMAKAKPINKSSLASNLAMSRTNTRTIAAMARP